MLMPMNYRRGFQRVYAVLAAVWVALVLLVSIRDRPKPIDWSAAARESGGVVDLSSLGFVPDKDQPLASVGGETFKDRNGHVVTSFDPKDLSPEPSKDAKRSGNISGWSFADEPKPPNKADSPPTLPRDFSGWDTSPEVRTRYWATRSAVGLLPPALLYLFLFQVIPWVYRGFRQA